MILANVSNADMCVGLTRRTDRTFIDEIVVALRVFARTNVRVLYTYADGDVAHGTYTKKGGAAAYACVCVCDDDLMMQSRQQQRVTVHRTLRVYRKNGHLSFLGEAPSRLLYVLFHHWGSCEMATWALSFVTSGSDCIVGSRS